jgi:SH3 domain protein
MNMKGIFPVKTLTLSLTAITMLYTATTMAETTFITDKIAVELFSSTFQRGVLITTVNSGATVDVIETDGDYAKIQTPDGQEGWLHTKYLSNEKPTQVSYLQLMAKHKQLEEELQQLKDQLKNSADANKEKAVLGKIRNDLGRAKKTISSLENQLKKKTAALEETRQQLAALEKQHQESLKDLQTAKSATPSAAKSEQETPEVKSTNPAEAPVMQSSLPIKPPFNLDYPIALKWLLATMLLSILIGIYWGYSWLDNKIARKHGGVRLR